MYAIRSYYGVQLAKRRRPASFIFVGPTGVGKTELVKVLAEELSGQSEAALCRHSKR